MKWVQVFSVLSPLPHLSFVFLIQQDLYHDRHNRWPMGLPRGSLEIGPQDSLSGLTGSAPPVAITGHISNANFDILCFWLSIHFR